MTDAGRAGHAAAWWVVTENSQADDQRAASLERACSVALWLVTDALVLRVTSSKRPSGPAASGGGHQALHVQVRGALLRELTACCGTAVRCGAPAGQSVTRGKSGQVPIPSRLHDPTFEAKPPVRLIQKGDHDRSKHAQPEHAGADGGGPDVRFALHLLPCPLCSICVRYLLPSASEWPTRMSRTWLSP